MNEGTIIYNIISHLSPWDRTQNAPLVCRKWAQIAKMFPMPFEEYERRAAWLVWKHLLEERGMFGTLLRESLPVSFEIEGFVSEIFELTGNTTFEDSKFIAIYDDIMLGCHESSHNFNQTNSNLYYVQEDIPIAIRQVDRYVAVYFLWLISYVRQIFLMVDPKFWSEFVLIQHSIHTPCRKDYPPQFCPLHECYQRLEMILESRFGITNIQYGPLVKKELETKK